MDVSSLLNQLVAYAPRTGVGTSGDPTFGTVQTDVAARVEDSPGYTRRGPGGNVAMVRAIVTFAFQVYAGDRIWLSGRDSTKASQALEVLEVNGVPDLDGNVEAWKAVCP